jgi:CubicO group peptidase (beta-lactamase class C family)
MSVGFVIAVLLVASGGPGAAAMQAEPVPPVQQGALVQAGPPASFGGGPLPAPPVIPPLGPYEYGPIATPLREAAPLAARLDELGQTRSICPVEEGQDPFEVVDAFAQQEMEARGFPGAQIAIVQGGELVHARGFGVKNRDEGGEVDAETQFRIGSVTKMMTAAAVLQQVEAGEVDLQTPLQHYVPQFSLANERYAADITVWNLLTHSSGVPELLTGFEMDGPKTPDALSEWAGSLGDVQPFVAPGSFWNYSNPNFSLAGLVAENVSGIHYNEYMVQELWSKAGMDATVLLPSDVMARGNYTFGHSRDLTSGEPVIYAPDDYDNWAFGPAGYAFSTSSDLVKFALLLMHGGGDVLRPESAEAMQAPQISLDTVPGAAYGYGIVLEPYNDLLLRDHGGNVLGWGAYLLWVPERDFAVATVNNADGNMTSTLVCAMEAVLGEPLPEQEDWSTDPSTWGPYAGEYHVVDVLFGRITGAGQTEFDVDITLEDDTLSFIAPDVPDFMNPMVPFSRTLTQAALNTFVMDADLDGNVDATWSVAFIDDPDDDLPESRWLRNRLFVGTRIVPAVPGLYVPVSLKH